MNKRLRPNDQNKDGLFLRTPEMNKLFRREQNERGDIVSTIVMTALIIMFTIIMGSILMSAMRSQAGLISSQIQAATLTNYAKVLSSTCPNLPKETVKALVDDNGYKTGEKKLIVAGKPTQVVATSAKGVFTLKNPSTTDVLCKIDKTTPTQKFDNNNNNN